MSVYTVNYPNLPGRIKSLFFRALSPEKRLSSLTVSEGENYRGRKCYPVVTDRNRSVKNRYIVFTEYDYCYCINLKKGIIVQRNGDWFSGRFDPAKKPVTGIACRNGDLIFYLFRIPLYRTGRFFRTLLITALFAAVCYFGASSLNILEVKNVCSRAVAKVKQEIKGSEPVVVNIDYSSLDSENPVEQWRPKRPLTGILGKMMQDAVNKYAEGKKKLAEHDYEAAYDLFSESSTAGFVPATYQVAMLFLNGSPDRKIAENKEYAKYFFRDAAVRGHLPSQFQLAECYLLGNGTEKSLKLAKYWGYKSAIAGFVPSQRLLGSILLEEKEKKLARQWFLYAAYQGDHEAQYQLGQCYQKGIGGAVDRKKSLFWYRLSSKNGNKKAASKINPKKQRSAR